MYKLPLVRTLFITCIIGGLVVAPRSRSDPPSPRYQIGARAAAAYVAARDITVFPTGKGLPSGHGTPREGRAVFEANCAACHGLHGEGLAIYPPLVGGVGTLQTTHPVFTVGSYWPYATTIWDYVRRAMPYDRPGTLSANEVYAVTGYLLFLNGIVQEDAVMDEQILPRIVMPNRDGFDPDPRPDLRPKQ